MKKQHVFLLGLLTSITADATAQFSWSQKQDAPDNRYEGVAFAAGDKVYYGLGQNASLGYADNKFYKYDPVTNTWDTIALFPGTPRRLASAFSVGGKGYVGFGVDPVTTLQLSDLWEYDPAQNLWTQKTGLPAASGWLAGTATASATKGYAGLGLHDHTSGFLNLNWWEYDPVADTWSQKNDIPGFGLYQPSSFTIGDSIYIVCGMGSALLVPTREVWLFDIQSNIWTQQPDFPGSARTSVSAFTIAGTGYAGYGLGNGATDLFNDFYSYDASSGIWTPELFCATALFDAACATTEKGYVINNTSWNSTSPDVWEYADVGTSISALEEENFLNVYPNPSHGIVKINAPHSAVVEVFDVEGKVLETFHPEAGENELNLFCLANGIYYVTMEHAGGVSRMKICIMK